MSKLTKEDIKLRNKITQRFVNLRRATGLSQSEFAKMHDVDRQQINRWESFKTERGVTIYTIMRFCSFLNISLKEFFDDSIFED